jgi:hypothetical protein
VTPADTELLRLCDSAADIVGFDPDWAAILTAARESVRLRAALTYSCSAAPGTPTDELIAEAAASDAEDDAEIAKLRADVARLREALQPFAVFPDVFSGATAENLRAAREALAATDPEGG